MKTFRTMLCAVLLAAGVGGCAGFDLDQFVTALEAENASSGAVSARPDSAAQLEPVVESPRGRVFAETIPVRADESRVVEAIPSDPGFEPAALSVADTLHAWVVGDNGAVARTSDGGASWQRVQVPGLTGRLSAVSFYDRRHGVIADSGSTVAVTADGGESWTVETLQRQTRIPEDSFWYAFTDDGLPAQSGFHSAHAHGPRAFLVGGAFGEVFLYFNGGWEERTIITGQTVYGIASASEGTILAATGIGLADNFGIERSSFLNPEWESIVNFTGPPAEGVRLSENGRLIAQGSAIMGDAYGDSTFSAASRMQVEGMPDALSRSWGPGDIRDDVAWVFLNPPRFGSADDENTLALMYSDNGGDTWVIYGSSIETGLTNAAMFEPGNALGIAMIPGTWNRQLLRLRW